MGSRVRRGVASVVSLIEEARASIPKRSRHAAAASAASSRTAGADRRIIIAIGAVAIIFLGALVIGHPGTSNAPSTAAGSHVAAVTTAPSAAPSHSAVPSAKVPATVATPPSAAPSVAPLPATLTVGGGGTGFQVQDIRYGQQPGYMRLVFDMGPAASTSGTSPTATVSFTNATTMMVTFKGTLPAGSTGTPPPGGVVTSVTQVASSGGSTTYRIALAHAVSPNAFYLTGTSPPLRFVLDLH